MSRAGWGGSVAAAALASCLVAGCGVGPEDQARALGPSDAPPGVLAPHSSAAQPRGARVERLLFVRDQRLVPVTRPAVQVTPASVLADLLAGPLPGREHGLTTAIPAGAGAVGVTVRKGIALVGLSPDLLDSGRSDQVLALAQIVTTLDAVPGVRGVQFLHDGQVLPVPRADGAVVAGPLTAPDYRDLFGAA